MYNIPRASQCPDTMMTIGNEFYFFLKSNFRIIIICTPINPGLNSFYHLWKFRGKSNF